MRLYRKKLDSLEALKREKIRLRYERKHTKATDLNPLAEVGGSKISGAAQAGMLGTLMKLFAAKNNLQLAMALSGPVLKAFKKRRSNKYERWAEEGRPRKKSFLKKLVADVAVSYIIGKAVQMTI